MRTSPRRPNSSRVNLVISLIFHLGVVLALVFVAAREGMLGKELRKIAVTMAPKEKPREQPKEPEPQPQPLPAAPEPQPAVDLPPVTAPPPSAAPVTPSSSSAPVAPSVAPPAAAVPSFQFSGGHMVESSSDPVVLYKGFVEYTLRARWSRPEHVDDSAFVAEVQVSIGPDGKIERVDWRRGSGHPQWDASVRRVVNSTSSIGRPPPRGFPESFLVRFDVQPVAEPLFQ